MSRQGSGDPSPRRETDWALGAALRGHGAEGVPMRTLEARSANRVGRQTWAHLLSGRRKVRGEWVDYTPDPTTVINAARTLGLDEDRALMMAGLDPADKPPMLTRGRPDLTGISDAELWREVWDRWHGEGGRALGDEPVVGPDDGGEGASVTRLPRQPGLRRAARSVEPDDLPDE